MSSCDDYWCVCELLNNDNIFACVCKSCNKYCMCVYVINM